MAPTTPPTLDNVVTQYEQRRDAFARFGAVLQTLVATLLDAKELRYFQVTARAKSVESFREKISREGKQYSDPLNEVTDLCGVRVVCYDTRTVPLIADLVRQNFVVECQHSVDRAQRLDPDRFGYLSVHHVVRLDASRAALPEYAPFAGLRAEVQVRTTLQHAWAALDHSLRYKATIDVPTELHRRLYRISALLELADDEFARLLDDADKVRATYSTEVLAGRLDALEINADSVESLLRDKPAILKELQLAAAEAGFALAPPPPTQKTPWTSLLRTVGAADISTLREFRDALERFMPHAKSKFRSIGRRWGEETASPRLVVDPSTLLRLAILFSLNPVSARSVLEKVRFGPSLLGVLESELGASSACQSKAGSIDAQPNRRLAEGGG